MPNDKSKAASKIKLGNTFFKIEEGQESIADAVKRKKAERDAAKAEVKKKGGVPEKTDPFLGNFER